MNLNAYVIYDRKAHVYHAPFFAISHGAAIRSFSDLANDRNTTIGRHPLDYVLFQVGGFDDASGMLLPFTAIEHVSDASSLVEARPDVPLFNGGLTQGAGVK